MYFAEDIQNHLISLLVLAKRVGLPWNSGTVRCFFSYGSTRATAMAATAFDRVTSTYRESGTVILLLFLM